MRVKKVFRYSRRDKMFRLFKLRWVINERAHGDCWEATLSFAISKRMFAFKRSCLNDTMLTLLWIRVHYQEHNGNGNLV